MAYEDALRSSWSVRQRAWASGGDPVFEELVADCQHICAEHLPPQHGYQISVTRLSGAMRGATVSVRRGPFRATVSLQRFERGESRELETRMVAAARHGDEGFVEDGNALARWTLTGSALGTTSVVSLGALSFGTMSATAVMLLVLPALVLLRVLFAARVAHELQRSALQTSPSEKLRYQARARALARDRRRWQAALRCLAEQQHHLAQRENTPPFRALAPGPVSCPEPDLPARVA